MRKMLNQCCLEITSSKGCVTIKAETLIIILNNKFISNRVQNVLWKQEENKYIVGTQESLCK